MSTRETLAIAAALERYPAPSGSTPLITTKEIAEAAVRSGLNVQARLGFAAGVKWADANPEVTS